MKKLKRKLSRSEALALVTVAPRVQVAQTPYDGRTGLQKFTEEFNRAEEETRTAPVRAAQTEHSRLLRELIDGDIPMLYSGESQFLAATAPQIGNGDQFNNIPPDHIRATIRRVFSEFEDSIASEGKITETGKRKLQSLARLNLECDWTQIASWVQALALLRAANELSDADFVAVQSVAQPAQPESFDDVLAKSDTFSREGRKQVAAAAMKAMSLECNQMFDAFYNSIVRNFGYSLNDSEVNAVVEFMKRHNLNFLKPSDWDRARVACVKAGLIERSDLLYPQEALSEAVEATGVPLDSYEARQDFIRRSRLIRG